VERWIPVTGNCFVLCICKQIIKYWWTCVFIRELGYANPWLFLHQKRRLRTLRWEQVQFCNTAVLLPMLVSGGFWTDWAPAAHQQTSFALIGHSQRTEFDSASNFTEKHYSCANFVSLRGSSDWPAERRSSLVTHRWHQLTLGRHNCLQSCRTQGFPGSANFEPKL
jgi:hypothetical protein